MKLLQTIVTVVKEVLYPTDILCRYGGEEFTVICSQTSEEKGWKSSRRKSETPSNNMIFRFRIDSQTAT